MGYSYLYNVYDGFNASNSNFPSNLIYIIIFIRELMTDDDHVASMGSYKNDNTLIGFFGRVSYGFDNRYNLMLSFRRRFFQNSVRTTNGVLSRQLLPAGPSAMSMRDLLWINNLKLRAGYGVTGIIPNASYASLVTYDYDVWGKHLSKDGVWSPSLRVAQNPNPNLKWEKTSEWNVGIDWSILNSRLGGAVDVYSKTTVDLLYYYNVPVPPNMYGQTLANVGQMRNNGIEFLLNAIPVQTRDFTWKTTLTLSHNSNKLLSLSNELYETRNFNETGGVSDLFQYRHTVWKPVTVSVISGD